MNDGVRELLNQLRTKAVGKEGDQNLLSISDSLEKIFSRQTDNLNQTHEMLSQAHAEITSVKSELELEKKKRYLVEERLRIELARRFGRSSERWTPLQKLQKELFNESEYISTQETDEEEETVITEKRVVTKKKKSGKIEKTDRGYRTPLPANLPREEVEIDLSKDEKQCDVCHGLMDKIGEEISEQLQIRPIEFYVEKTKRPVYACKKGCGCLRTAAVPNQIYPKSMLGETVISQIIVSKFCDALPFYRQEAMLLRSDIKVSRQTMARTAAQAAKFLAPLNELINRLILKSKVICADETRVRVLNEKGLKKDGNSWMWVTAGEYEKIKLVRFHYAGSRGKEVVFELLDGFTGILMTDAYSAYDSLAKANGLIQAACMAHVRRKFHDVLKGDRKNPLANEFLGLIKDLYDIERENANVSPEERYNDRQKRSKPIMDKMVEWLYTHSPTVLPKSALGIAISYALNQLPRLKVFLSNGLVPIDNNRAENAIRPFCVGRRNWLFHDQAEGAVVSSALYSIIETAKANLVEPMHYITFLFRCYKKYGPDKMPWKKLLPSPDLRSYAQEIGVPWEL